MFKHAVPTAIAAFFLLVTAPVAIGSGETVAPLATAPTADAVALPPGVRAVWDLEKACREATPTRDRICLNGLWRWQPAENSADAVPAGRWGYFKTPGCWPGITDYMQKDCQTIYAHPSWKDKKLANIAAAWYQREITIPAAWAGRRIAIDAEYVNSWATVYVDGKKAGEIRFPGGEVDITSACRPGGTRVLSILVQALPLKGLMLSYTDTAAARMVQGKVERRGLCGDVWLVATPAGPRIADVKVDTSTRKWEITFDAALDNLPGEASYALRARITDTGRNVTEFVSKPFKASDLENGRFTFTEKWRADKLWDLNTPGSPYQISLTLQEAGGKALDTALPVPFAFREFWIDGRDFRLNGSRIFLSAVPLDNAQVGAAWATYEAAKESLLRLKSFGINLVYTHNYGCEPGSHLSFTEILRAADDVGMLVSFSQPHFGHYEWKAPDADRNNGYARHAEFYVRAAQNHPSVVFYSMSHNGAGYNEDMNPDLIDGVHDPRDTWSSNNSKLALRAESVVKRLDPGRIVYHHSAGNLGSMHTINFYPNFVPIQEMSDWFEHWATEGVKPAFTCEYGAPFTWDWTMYRGWYKDERTFGSARVPWEFSLAEWDSQFLGDRAYRLSEPEKANLRWEAKQSREGKLWYRWDYPYEVGSRVFDDRYAVLAMYLTDNWRAFRTWGLSANSPWEHGFFWKLREGLSRNRRQDFRVDWENLQRPGFSPDFVQERYERMDLAYERSDWVPTPAAEAMLRNNSPLLAYIANKPQRFTSKDHNFLPGQAIDKQIIVINNSREPVTCDCEWTLGLPQVVRGTKRISVKTGEQERIPLHLALPAALAPGSYELSLTARFSNGQTQTDALRLHILPQPAVPKPSARIALFDPRGDTTKWLAGLGIQCQAVDAKADLAGCDVLIIGKAALTVDGPGLNLARVREGLKVIVFEQTSAVLEKRLGFRVAEYGLRQVFPRVPDHPLLVGIGPEHLRDWRGEATILPPRLKYEPSPRFNGAPAVRWCDIEVTRLWRCGNWGNVASVLIEKPAVGDFLPILDGGFGLQYSPLLVYREGAGMIVFCQLDVTARTENDPAAEMVGRNILQYISSWKPSTQPGSISSKPTAARKVFYAGEAAGRKHLEKSGLSLGEYDGGKLSAEDVLIVGPGGGRKLAPSAAALADWLKAGGNLLAIGLDEPDAAFLPFKVTLKKAEHIATHFEPFGMHSPLAGIGPADLHNRDPRELQLVTGGAAAVGDGVLAMGQNGRVIFCQFVPWQFDYARQHNIKPTYRRASFVLARLLAGMGIAPPTPLLDRFSRPVDTAKPEQRWLNGLYLDQPEEWDDPYRFFRW